MEMGYNGEGEAHLQDARRGGFVVLMDILGFNIWGGYTNPHM